MWRRKPVAQHLLHPYTQTKPKQQVIRINFKFFSFLVKVKLIYAILFSKIAIIPLGGTR